MDSQLLELLQAQLSVTFEETLDLEDQSGEKHHYRIAHIRGAIVYFDVYGQIWMNEAEIARALGLSKQAVQNAIARISSQNNIFFVRSQAVYLTNRRGELRLISLFEGYLLILLAFRSNSFTSEAALFIQDFKKILQLGQMVLWGNTKSIDIFDNREEAFAPTALNRSGVVYLIMSKDLFKIGMTRQMENRWTALLNQYPDIKLIHIMKATNRHSAERSLHDRFSEKRVHGEWFALTDEDVQWIMQTYPEKIDV